MRILGSLLFATIVGGFYLSACSSTTANPSAGGCGSAPFTCPAGQTCSVKDASGATACLPSGSGKKGDACLNTVGAAACADNLVCLQVVQSGGSCVPYCEPGSSAHACPAAEQCRAATFKDTSTIFYICIGSAPPVDAGAGGAGPGDAAAAAAVDASSDSAVDAASE